MASRLQLHQELINVLGTNQVYFQPPESVKMKYDAIVYNFSAINTRYADNLTYLNQKSYDLTVISRNPDNDLVDKLLGHFRYIRFNRRFISDNLYHDTLTLYY